MSTMSMGEIRAHYDKLTRKSSLNSRESAELAVCEAMLFNGGEITAQKDYTPPKRSTSSKLWDWS
jgi:hypothetical protein